MTNDEFIAWLKKEEGVVKHAYQDHLGYWTIGVGRLIDKRKGGGLSNEEIDYLLNNDVEKKIAEVRKALPWFDNLTSNRKAVLVAMAFQMGTAGLLGFKNSLKLVEAGEYDKAATNFLKSKWATKDTPARAKRTMEIFRRG